MARTTLFQILFSVLVALGLLVGQAVQAKADYLFTTIDVPGSLPNTEFFSGINNSGQLVGYYTGNDQNQHGFLYSGGTYTTLDVPNSTYARAEGINAAGQIVGNFGGPGQNNGFILNGGIYTTLNVLPGVSTFTDARGINGAGQVVGNWSGGGFLYSGGSFTTFTAFGSSVTSAYSINASGQIVGLYFDPKGNAHGFLKMGDNYTVIDPPGSVSTEAHGINASGQIVGSYHTNNGHNDDGFMLDGGIYTTFDVPGSLFTRPFGINDAGEIVGMYQASDFTFHGFLATPVSEPSTFLLLVVGSLGLISWRRHRRQLA